MTFKKLKFFYQGYPAERGSSRTLVTLLSNLSRCAVKQNQETKIPDTAELQLNMFVMKVWPGSRNILLTRLGREGSPIPVQCCLSAPDWSYQACPLCPLSGLLMFAPSIYINKTIVFRTLKKNYGRFINQENFPPRQL